MSHALDLTGVAGDPDSRVHRLDPRAKAVGLLGVTVVAVSAPLRLWPVFAGCAVVLALVALAARVPPRVLWQRGRIVLGPVLALAALIPFVRDGGAAHALGPLTVHGTGLTVAGALAAKALIGTTAALLLGATTAFPALLRGLGALGLPRLLVLVATLMYRYLFVVCAELQRTRAALAARAYRPRSALQAGALGRAAGTLFLRTHDRGERVHLAMLARGYDGRIPQAAPLAFGRADAAFVAAVALALLPLRVLAGGLA